MNKKDLFQTAIKMAMILAIIQGVMLFIVEFNSAEFYVLVIGIVLMLIMILFGFIKTRRNKDDE